MSSDEKEKLVNRVMNSIMTDFYNNDIEALYELLSLVDERLLTGYLPEE